MKKVLSGLFILLWATSTLAQVPSESKTSTFYFIRHAEKDTSNPADRDPDLVMEGVLRAARWSSVFNRIDFISSTLPIISGRATPPFLSPNKKSFR